jgi:hypothetical protein
MYRWAQRYFGHASRTAESADDAASGRQAESGGSAAARRDQRAAEENSARDRAARDDRKRAANPRRTDAASEDPSELPPDTHSEDVQLIGQAQSIVMDARDLTAEEALLALYQRANTDGTNLRTTALRIIDERAES